MADIGLLSGINIRSEQFYFELRVSEGDEEVAPRLGREDGEQELTDVAQSALPAVGTEALVGVESVDAGPSVAAGVAGTIIDVWRGRCGGDKVLINTRGNETCTKSQQACLRARVKLCIGGKLLSVI